ncbi:MAG: energy transducer TonB [Bacteroidales bacterium]|nr:energy transducer TonB [Bacteroidales bacterium]
MIHKVQIILFLFLVSPFCIFSQKAELDKTQTDSTKLIKEQQFKQTWEIVREKGIKSKIIEEVIMKSEPSVSSPDLNISILQNNVVYAFKYFKANRFWAIKYKDDWGFVPDDFLMAISEKEGGDENPASQWDVPPQIKTSITPRYPKSAENSGIEGSVIVKIFIDKKGTVTQTLILKGIPELNSAAIETINKAKFTPAKLNGKPVGVWTPISINFKIK